jgi:outer membrane protein OmpA-like peptidoglycan-associated protein
VAWALMLLAAAQAAAQTASSGTSTALTQSGTQTSSSATSTDTGIRPATTTFFGDTGLWFVPTGEVLPHGKWSVSGYRRGTNFIHGFTNVGDFAGTFGVGVRDRAEIFGSFLVDTRVDRDLRPLFTEDEKYGGVVDRNPRVNRGWSGDNIGDFYVGGKYNFWSEYRQQPAALALRGMLKLPTGDDEAGASTGKTDFIVDAIFSKEYNQFIEVAGNAGWEFRGSPDDIEIPGGAFRWGIGAAVGSRNPLRFTIEVNGEMSTGDTTITSGSLIGTDGSMAPRVTETSRLTRATAGLTYQARNGFFIGGGIGSNIPMKSREDFGADSDPGTLADFTDWQVRIGFHPGVRVYVPPPPPPPTPAPPPAAPVNRPPTVTAACNPCIVEPGGRLTLSAKAQDPDGDKLTYLWSCPSGKLENSGNAETGWIAGQQEGPVTCTVTVDDGRGGKAQATVNVEVRRPPVKQYTFEDVHFDFDRSTLRAEAQRVLDEAVKAMQADPALRLQIEGHTCNIGTAEYNLALGDRRASSVRDYLASRGIAATRLSTVSYGEERPRHDNSREETRRLNRRAALTVNLTK